MSRRRHSSRRRDAAVDRGPTTYQGTVGSAAGLLSLVVSVLVTTRFFLPAESAALGETLWIVQFWFIAGVFWLWAKARSGRPLRRLDGLDVGLGLLVGGHVLSAIVVLSTEGDRRAALNMLWEWLAIGVSALMIREIVRQQLGRNCLLSAIVISSITLSGYGLWQHYVWYPSISAMLTEVEELSSQTPSTQGERASRERRLSQLNRDLGMLSFDGDSGARKLLRARIESSVEPIGRFALANTFAGLLLVGLLLGIGGVLLERNPQTPIWRLGAATVLLTTLAFCFWLTKSRTAWVGLIVGLVVGGAAAGPDRRVRTGLLRIVGGAVLLLVALPVFASLLGGLDREVITESPKSMQYRLEYWSATGSVIRAHPWIGVGPGNFRQAYLRHKLPGSSEEVLDPHNLLLDVWANGGLIAFAGLLTTLFFLRKAMAGVKERQNRNESPQDVPTTLSVETFLWRALLGTLALGGAALVGLFTGVGGGNHTWWLLAGWCGVSVIWPPICWTSNGGPALAAAITALIVHLLGAGGVAMPAILQMLVIVAACLVDDASLVDEPATVDSTWEDRLPWKATAGAVVCFCFAAACAVTATLPVSESTTQLQLGRAFMARGSALRSATASFEAAAVADPLSGLSWQELALARMTDWTRGMGADDELFSSAVSAQEEAIRCNPKSANPRLLLGRMWWRRYEQSWDQAAAVEACRSFREAVENYPNQAAFQAEYAKAAVAAGEMTEARQAASEALRLDELNQNRGHIDKLLPEKVRDWATTLVEEGL